MGKSKRQYNNEYKAEAVRLSYQRENIKELADELGIHVQRIYKWRAMDRGTERMKVSPVKKQEEQEIKELRKALKNAQLELEILKKAVHIFSKSDGKSINL